MILVAGVVDGIRGVGKGRGRDGEGVDGKVVSSSFILLLA